MSAKFNKDTHRLGRQSGGTAGDRRRQHGGASGWGGAHGRSDGDRMRTPDGATAEGQRMYELDKQLSLLSKLSLDFSHFNTSFSDYPGAVWA